MKKIVTSLAVALAATSAFAGGLLTTTNQNAHSLRFFAQDADINLTSLYANPAGSAFLNKGWHISASAMTAMQTRSIATTNPLYAGDKTHNFKGDAFAPVVPSFDFAYVQDKWSVSARFGVVAGGGTCEFENGLGSFENIVAGLAAQNGLPSYDFNSYLKGTQNYFGLQIGGTYKIIDNLSAYVGVRGVIASCGYEGYLKTTLLGALAQGVPAEIVAQGIALDCAQSDFGVTPIIGIHYSPIKGLDFAAKYEFRTRIGLKNKTTFSPLANALMQNPMLSGSLAPVLGQYADGQEIRNDIPAILTVGGQYRPIEGLKIAASWRYYFDKSATKDGFANGEKINMNNLIDNNTMEFLASAEWKFCKWVAASFSWQNTSYGLSDAYMSDTDFNLSSNSIGTGLRIYPCSFLNIDLGYMHTFYKDRTVATPATMMSNLYSRTNDVVGLGLNFSF